MQLDIPGMWYISLKASPSMSSGRSPIAAMPPHHACQPLFKSGVAPFAFGRVDRTIAVLAWIKF